MIRAVRTAEDTNISVYVGLDDEGLAVEGGSFIRDGDDEMVQKLLEFNRTENYAVLY